MKQNKDFNVRITVKFAEDYKINATSKEEAMKIAEDGYEGGLYDPHNHGEFFHEVEIVDNNEKPQYFKKTKMGYDIIAILVDETNDLHIIGQRKNDFFVGVGYNPKSGDWRQGLYGYINSFNATKALEEYKKGYVFAKYDPDNPDAHKSMIIDKLAEQSYNLRCKLSTVETKLEAAKEELKDITEANNELREKLYGPKEKHSYIDMDYFKGLGKEGAMKASVVKDLKEKLDIKPVIEEEKGDIDL